MEAKFGLFVDEDHSKLFTLYQLPKRHKRPYKSRFIANSSACTTTELFILLTSCLTAIKNYVIKYCTTVYVRNGKNLFWSIKNYFKNIFDFTTAGDWDCVAAVERLPALHYSIDFIFLSFGNMGFIVEL